LLLGKLLAAPGPITLLVVGALGVGTYAVLGGLVATEDRDAVLVQLLE
jgi:hypothetical protein